MLLAIKLGQITSAKKHRYTPEAENSQELLP